MVVDSTILLYSNLKTSDKEIHAILEERPKSLWKAQPDLRTASEAWIIAGGAHHTVFSHALNLDDMRQFAELNDIELTVIDNDTRLPAFKDALRWNEVYYGSKR